MAFVAEFVTLSRLVSEVVMMPLVSVNAPETDTALSKVTPLALLMVRLFIADIVVEDPGKVVGPAITIVPLLMIVPPLVQVPLIVNVTPLSTIRVPLLSIIMAPSDCEELICSVAPLLMTVLPL